MPAPTTATSAVASDASGPACSASALLPHTDLLRSELTFTAAFSVAQPQLWLRMPRPRPPFLRPRKALERRERDLRRAWNKCRTIGDAPAVEKWRLLGTGMCNARPGLV